MTSMRLILPAVTAESALALVMYFSEPMPSE